MGTMLQATYQKGFTLIELMVTLVVLAVLLSIGVPSYVEWIRDSRLDTATRSLASALKLARSEAVSQQSVITVGAGMEGDAANWAEGIHMYTDEEPAGNTNYAAGTDALIKNINFAMDGITLVSNAGEHTSFSNEGLLRDDVNPATFRLCDARSEGNLISINVVGRISVAPAGDCP